MFYLFIKSPTLRIIILLKHCAKYWQAQQNE